MSENTSALEQGNSSSIIPKGVEVSVVETTPSPNLAATNPKELESKHVHSVYNQIGDHFSDTRYKPWPVIDAFLREMTPGSLGCDVGCGNGKYIQVNPKLFVFGSDRSEKLIGICGSKGMNVIVADNLALPYRDEGFDFTLSIAVIHHMSTRERRIAAIQELTRVTRVGGRILIFVWAMEQQRKQFAQQDVFVPWHVPNAKYSRVLDANVSGTIPSSTPTNLVKRADGTYETVFQRFYHVFVKGELEELIQASGPGLCIVRSGYDRDNWFAECERVES